jgi:hypothetical protein
MGPQVQQMQQLQGVVLQLQVRQQHWALLGMAGI